MSPAPSRPAGRAALATMLALGRVAVGQDGRVMTPNLQMEQFSLAYIRAVASSAGYHVTRPETDMDSVDGLLLSDAGRRPRIEFQAKATSRDLLRTDGIYFPLPVKNYDGLRVETPLIPRILIVLLMPVEEAEWLTQTGDELCQRHCAYWRSLEGEPAVPNTQTVTVRLPLDNMFSRDQLDGLMGKVERGDPL